MKKRVEIALEFMPSKQINIGLQINGKILQFEHCFFISKYNKTNFNEKRKKNVQI